MTQSDQIAHKLKLVTDLHLQEDNLNRELHHIDTMMKYAVAKMTKEKKKIRKHISHNMRFRNKVINELSKLKQLT